MDAQFIRYRQTSNQAKTDYRMRCCTADQGTNALVAARFSISQNLTRALSGHQATSPTRIIHHRLPG